LGGSWEALGRSWAALGRSWGDLGPTCKNHPKIDAKNDRFGLPKGRQNGANMRPKSVQKTVRKTNRKNNKNHTKIKPSKSQKSLKNLRKINKNQKMSSSYFDTILAPKTSQNGSPKRSKNDFKTI